MSSPEAAALPIEQVAFEEFVFPDRTGRFAVLKTFRLPAVSAASTPQVVASLLAHASFRDSYQAPGEASVTTEPIHGPYRLDALSPASYIAMEAVDANHVLDQWLAEEEEREWEGPDADAANAHFDAAQPAVRAWFAERRPLFERGEVMHLPELDESCQHETGWTLWDFAEWLVIDRESHRVYMLSVARD